MNNFIYKNSRPDLIIERGGGAKLGSCYYSSSYTITSTKMLSSKTIRALFYAGFLGYGQEFNIRSQCDGKEEPAGTDHIPCKEYDERTGELVSENAINPWSGEPYKPHSAPYYVYNTVTRCDSSD